MSVALERQASATLVERVVELERHREQQGNENKGVSENFEEIVRRIMDLENQVGLGGSEQIQKYNG